MNENFGLDKPAFERNYLLGVFISLLLSATFLLGEIKEKTMYIVEILFFLVILFLYDLLWRNLSKFGHSPIGE